MEWKIEKSIREAILTRRIQQRLSAPQGVKDTVGRHIVIPNDERSWQDIQEDAEYNRIKDDEENVRKVFDEWLPILHAAEREVVLLRCAGMGWKMIAVKEHCGRRTAIRYFKAAIGQIERKFFGGGNEIGGN